MPIFFAEIICYDYDFSIQRCTNVYFKDASEMQSISVAAPRLQRLAESSPGLVWRERDENDPIIGERLGPDFILNLSAWRS